MTSPQTPLGNLTTLPHTPSRLMGLALSPDSTLGTFGASTLVTSALDTSETRVGVIYGGTVGSGPTHYLQSGLRTPSLFVQKIRLLSLALTKQMLLFAKR